MPVGASSAANVKSLADLIEADIRHRGLRTGDQYLNAVETGRRFGVSTRSANSALQLLAHRKLVSRRQRVGTVVTLSQHDALPNAELDVVHLVLQEAHVRREGVLTDGVTLGLQRRIPKADIRFSFVPADDEATFIDQLIHMALKSNQKPGFVVVRASLETQRAVGRSGLPSVIHGTTCPSVENVSSLDRDGQQCGRLMVEWLATQRCQNLLLLLRNQMHPGHHVMLDAVFAAAQHYQIDPTRITQRFLPSDELAVEREVLCLQNRSFNGKCGIICDSRPIADGAIRAIRQLPLPSEISPKIIASTVYLPANAKPPSYPYIYPDVDPEEIGVRIGELLVDQTIRHLRPVHATYPVRLSGVDPK